MVSHLLSIFNNFFTPDTQNPDFVDERKPADVQMPQHTIFTTDWFSDKVCMWEKQLRKIKGQPGLHLLEIGVFEGRSTVWLLEKILNHKTSRITCIDTFDDFYIYVKDKLGYEHRFDQNVRPYKKRLKK